MRRAYTGSGSMICYVDDTARITLSSIPSAFGTAPATAYWGSSQAGDQQGDATYQESGQIYYGDGNAEATKTADGTFEDTQTYAAFPGAGSYHTAYLGIQKAGGFEGL